MSLEKFQSDKNYGCFMVGVDKKFFVVFGWYDSTNKKSIFFIWFKLLMTHFIGDKIFHTFTQKTR